MSNALTCVSLALRSVQCSMKLWHYNVICTQKEMA